MDKSKVIEQVLLIKQFLDNQKAKKLAAIERPAKLKTTDRLKQELAELSALISATSWIILNVTQEK